ncbi:MAG: VOC family protein [Candidatus Dormibacteraeota bacterium]|nr:VOC family protein [Candidatus Dormibacteraeota bacterium]
MRIAHVGVPAKDPDALADFYARFLGLHQLARVTTAETGEMVLLSGRPQAEPELALMSNQEARHVAFRVETLAELRAFYAAAPEHQAQVLFSFDHGSTLSLYFRDPEGNACELYWPTGRRPSGSNRPIDLAKPEPELLQMIGA